MPPPKKVAKVVLVGESGVGKSSILSTYFGEPFSHVYVQTKEREIKKTTLNVGRQPLELQIWDTPGNPVCRTITAACLREEVQGAVCIFDVTRDDTYYNMQHWVTIVNTYAGSGNVKFVFVGNKVDQKERTVNVESGEQLAKQYNGIYIDVSARQNFNVNAIFQTIAERIDDEGGQENAGIGDENGQEGDNSMTREDRGFQCIFL